MQLTTQETASAFWDGAKKGLVRSFGYIAALGLPVGGLMLAGVLPGVSVTVAVISILSTALTVGMFSGHQALSNYHQQKHNSIYDAKLARLEGRATALEQEEMLEGPVHSPRLTTILEEGAKQADRSFAAAEEARINAPATRTLH